MKILILSNRFFSIYNSRQKIIRDLVSENYTVIVAAQFDGFEEKLDNVDKNGKLICINCSFATSNYFSKNMLLLRRIIKKESPQIVHAFNPIPIFVSSIFKIFFRYKLVLTITGLGGAYGHKSRFVMLYNLFYKFAIINSDKVVFQNRDDYNYFKDKIDRKFLKKIKVITSSGVDLERFSLENTKDVNREKDNFKLLFIARLIRQKGIVHLVNIAKKLLKIGNIEIHIFGEYVPEHKDSISNKEYLELVNLPNVKFHGFVEDIEKQYHRHDLLICCSLREGVPRVILEASACGVPVVAFDVPGVREGVKQNVNGFLISDFNIDSFVKRIHLIMEDKYLYAQLSQNSREYISNRFSQEAILKEYLNIYTNIKNA